MNVESCIKLIRDRKSVFPGSYNDEPVSKEELDQILESARWAPTHKKTEPWKFKVFRKKGLSTLSDFLLSTYLEKTPIEKQSERKINKLKANPLKSSAVIALILDAHPESLPEWEEIASLAMSVQNMYLTCTALEIGCYWSTPMQIQHMTQFLSLSSNQKCLGLLYIGRYNSETAFPERERKSIEEISTWINA